MITLTMPTLMCWLAIILLAVNVLLEISVWCKQHQFKFKVGHKVYVILDTLNGSQIFREYILVITTDYRGTLYETNMGSFYEEDIGKMAFPTRAKAEKKLSSIERDNMENCQ